MKFGYWKPLLLVGLVAVAGCDLEDHIRSVLYSGDTESVTPTEETDDETSDHELAPGVTPEGAPTVAVGAEMPRSVAAIESPDDVHWYALEADGDEAAMVEVSVTPLGDLDAAIHLESPGDEPPIRYDIADAGEAEEIPRLEVPVDGQRRFFVAGSGETTGDYRIEFRRRLSAATVAMAPNDHPESAMQLEVPGEIQGFYERPHDRDIFFVPAESLRAGIYSLELSAIRGIEQTLEIFGDESFDEPLMQISVSERRPAVIPNLSLDAERGDGEGLYFALEAGKEFDRSQGYRLRLVEHPDDDEEFVVEREPNDTAATAQSVEFGEPIRGYFHTPGDVDRFRLVIEEPEPEDDADVDEEEADDEPLAEAEEEEEKEEQPRRPEALREMLAAQEEFEGGPRPEADREERAEELEQRLEEGAELVDPWSGVEDKEPPEYVVQARLSPLGDAHRMALRWLPDEETGEQSVRLVADDEEEELVVCNRVVGPGEYDIELEAVESDDGFRPRSYDYQLEVMNIADRPGLEIEPNDTPETADRLEHGETRTGFIQTAGDVDVYAFVVGPETPHLVEDEDDDETEASGWEAPETQQVRVELAGNQLDLGFELLDDEGGRVANVDEGGPGSDESLQIDLPVGLYYVAVSADSGSLCDPYHIEVTTD